MDDIENLERLYEEDTSDDEYLPPQFNSSAKRIKLNEVAPARPKNKALDDLYTQFNDLVSSNKSKTSYHQDAGIKRKPAIVVKPVFKKLVVYSDSERPVIVENVKAKTALQGKSQIKAFKCSICGMSFLYKNTLDRHIERHQEENDIATNAPDELSAATKRRLILGVRPRTNFVHHICGCCKFQFLDQESLEIHEINHENIDGTFGCLKCKQFFLTKDEVVTHTIEHSNDKEEFPCTECSKVFTNENLWEQHLRFHFGERPHQCGTCDRRFAFRKQLSAHEMEHKKQFPYQCKFCLNSYKDQDKYNTHMLCHKLKNDDGEEILGDKDTICITGEMKCKNCPRVLPDIVQLHAHTIDEHALNMQCMLCGHEADDFSALTLHLKEHLTLDFECPECPQKFEDDDSFKKHLATHKTDAKKMFGCDQCDKSYVDKLRLSWHKLSAHKGMRYICDFCNKPYTSLKGLRDHMQNHIRTDKVPCDDCGELFVLESHLKRHKLRMHGDIVNIKCPICLAVYTNEFLYNRHKKGHETKAKEKPTAFVRCVECNKFFKGKKALRNHELNSHLSVGRFDCNFCDHFFKTETALKTHIRNTHEKKVWKCLDCVMPFQTEEDYNGHMEMHKSERWNKKPKKTNYHDKPMTCEVCGQWTRGKYWYDIHMRRHTGERPYKCIHCSLSFVTRSNMNKHTMIHTHAPTFICNICNRGFRTERTLKIHTYLHTGKRPLSCEVCGKTFSTAYNKKICLIKHQQKGETVENFPDEERVLIRKKEEGRIKLSQIKNALVAKVGTGGSADYVKVDKKFKTIEEESSNAVASIQDSMNMKCYEEEEIEHHYEEFVLEENSEHDGEIMHEDIEPGQVIYKISEFDRPQVQVTSRPKTDLYINKYLKNLEQSKNQTHEEVIVYENDDNFPDDIIEYDSEEPEEEIYEFVNVEFKQPSKAAREHDEFLKQYLKKIESEEQVKQKFSSNIKLEKLEDEEILKDESYDSKYIPIIDTEEVLYEEETIDEYVEFEETNSMADQELETAVETIDGNYKETKTSARQSYARDHSILPAMPAGVSDAHLKYGSNRQGASTRLIGITHNRCQYCKTKFDCKEDLDEHILIEHVPERPFACDVCDYRFKQKCKLDRHARMHTSQKVAKCEICHKEFTRVESLTAHMKLHNNEQSHECSVCHKRFNDATSCLSHNFICMKREKQIAESGAEIVEFESLEVILNCMNDTDLVGRYKLDNCDIVDGSNKCSFCDKTFKRVESLTEHLKVHKIQTLLAKFKCKYCSHTFTSNGQYALHVASHERSGAVKGAHGSGNGMEICSICAKLVKRKEMGAHMTRQHPKKLFRCPECKKCHAEYSKLRKHVIAVHSERDIKCSYCPKTFSTLDSLKTHQAYHENPLLPCPHCGLEFQEAGLKRHVKRHELERPETCPYCPETFPNKPQMRVHLMQTHKNML